MHICPATVVSCVSKNRFDQATWPVPARQLSQPLNKMYVLLSRSIVSPRYPKGFAVCLQLIKWCKSINWYCKIQLTQISTIVFYLQITSLQCYNFSHNALKSAKTYILFFFSTNATSYLQRVDCNTVNCIIVPFCCNLYSPHHFT